MKKIGILGGMSWESTVLYYSLINQKIRDQLGGLNSARLLLSSVNFADIAQCQARNDWQEAADILREEAIGLERAGADFILIATNTMHKILPLIEQDVGIPFLHIADATGQAIQQVGHTRVGFIGTHFSMEDSFYSERLEQKFGLEVIIPGAEDREFIHRVIFDELCQGKILESSRARYLEIINDLKAQGAQCVIEGCTEITLLVKQEHTDVELFDTTKLHAEAAVHYALTND